MRPRISHCLRLIGRPLAGRRTFASTPHNAAAYGFIGLGRMGLPMAKNLRAKINQNDTLAVFDVNKKAMEEFVQELGSEHKATIAGSAREVADQSDTIITSLPEPSHVESVFESILSSSLSPLPSADQSARLFIDTSTIDAVTSRRIAKKVSASPLPAAFVDAPMSGGVVGARAGTLTFMLGAPADLVPRAEAVLALMGKRIIHLGDQGAGLAGKLANNYLLALSNIATAEAMVMGVKWGLDPKALAGLINSATGRCWPSEVNNPVPGVVEGAPAGRDYEGGFGVSLMKKDLRLAMDSVREFSVKNLLGKEALKVYDAAEQHPECKGRDFSVVIRLLESQLPEDKAGS